MKGRTSGFKARKNWRPLCKVGSEEKYDWAINKITEKSVKHLMLTAGNWENGATTSSTSAPPLSKLEVLRATSSVMAETPSVF